MDYTLLQADTEYWQVGISSQDVGNQGGIRRAFLGDDDYVGAGHFDVIHSIQGHRVRTEYLHIALLLKNILDSLGK
jgi:hypothetical protein